MTSFFRKLRWLAERGRKEAELREEIESHLEMEAEESDGDVYAARRSLGNLTLIQEDARMTWGWTTLSNLTQDLRYAVRTLRRSPGFTVAAILSLALGIGANAAIFTLADQILLRLLPVENPSQLVQIRIDGRRPGGNRGDNIHTVPYPTFLALRDQNKVFSGLTGQVVEPVSLTGDGPGQLLPVGMVAGNYFEVLGVKPYLGRMLALDDDRQLNGQPVVVLQFDFWRTHFHERQTVIGESIRLNGYPFTVIGVAAQEFEGTDVGSPTKLWIPVSMISTVTPNLPHPDDPRMAWFYLFGRLKPGVTSAEAEAAMRVLYRQRQQEELQQPYFSKFPEQKNPFLQQVFRLEPANRGNSELRTRFERPLTVLLWLSGAVLLIACSNVAGLLLARGAARQRELAIRGAIGAGRSRIAIQLFTESLLLALAGGLAGLFLAPWLTRMLIALLPYDAGVLSISADPDSRILLFTATLTATTAIVFGVLPAWRNSSAAPELALRRESGAIMGGTGHARLRKLFVALQVGLSAMLLLAAGLFVRTLTNLRNVDLGMRLDNVVTFQIVTATPYKDEGRKLQAFRSVFDRLRSIAGVKTVGGGTAALFTGEAWGNEIELPNAVKRSGATPWSIFNAITPGYFEALGIPVTAGRDLDWRDWGSGKRFALVNKTLTRKYFGGEAPLGVLMGHGARSPRDIEIVGVFGDTLHNELRGEIPVQTFVNLDSMLEMVDGLQIFARVEGDAQRVMPVLRETVLRTDANLVVRDMRTMSNQVNFYLADERLLSLLSIGFALLATALAVVGLHGVLTFVIGQRTRELGIRIALGAKRSKIVGLVAREMAMTLIFGLLIGIAAGYACAQYVENQLFGVHAHDPLVFFATILVLLTVGGVATLTPAMRAARIDPMSAMRHE